MQTTTTAQAERSKHRDQSGKFIKNTCDCCGKGAPMSYVSDDRCNTNGGFGVTLHARCANALAKLTDDEYAAMARFVEALREW